MHNFINSIKYLKGNICFENTEIQKENLKDRKLYHLQIIVAKAPFVCCKIHAIFMEIPSVFIAYFITTNALRTFSDMM